MPEHFDMHFLVCYMHFVHAPRAREVDDANDDEEI